MLTQNTIDQIKEVELSKVVGHYLADLKKKGSNWKACCPFHNEKSPSFTVNDVKGFYKCFGCGVSGNAISFVRDHEKQTFIEACKTIAGICGIEIEEEELTEAQKEILSAAELQEKVLNYVVPIYQKALLDLKDDHPAKIWLKERHVDDDVIDQWKLGWCSEEWRSLTPDLINKQWFQPASKLGIIKTGKDERHYDGYRSRIIFPIEDQHGRIVGLGGRYIKMSDKDGKDVPKYINPSECELYDKSVVLYGLNQAAKHIKEATSANVVEGYMDVISPHRVGIQNTVATCGTAFTERQIKLLKKHTTHAVLWRDNDSAGNTAFIKNLHDLLRGGFKVSKAMYKQKDPDEFVLKPQLVVNGIACIQKPILTDAITHLAHEVWEAALDDLHSKSDAKSYILKMISNISNEFLRGNFCDQLSRHFKWKPTDSRKELASILETTYNDDDQLLDDEDRAIKFPEWISEEQKEEVMRTGYVSLNQKDAKNRPMVGYYSFTQNGKTEITNFTVKPLFRIEAGQESRYLSEINNGYVKGVVDMPAKVFPSPEQFQGMCISAAGAFLIYGSKNQWLRIATDLLHKYPSCMEVSELGWQKRGNFFAFVDKVYIPEKGLLSLDEWGIVKHNEQNYLIPAGSAAYKKLQQYGKDPYENQRFLTYRESPIDFSSWANQMQLVYKEKGIVGIAYSILTLFKDVVFDVDNNCPHLYAFGEPSSGKSKFAESITAIFFFRRAALNLNSGTDFAFFNYMSMFANCPAHLNEFDIEVIKLEWFQAIKGAFDGEGRERGKIGAKNATEIQRIASTLILTGQKLVTADDNSVVTRSIIEPFSTVSAEDRKPEEIQAYTLLKDWERTGLNGVLLEVLKFRVEFETGYKDAFNKQLSDWRKNNPETKELNQRILQNFAHLATCYAFVAERLNMPQPVHEFKDYCFKSAIKWSAFIRSSDTLSEFWRTLEFLASNDSAVDGWDFVVEQVMFVNIRVNRTETKKKDFDQPTNVLFLRLNNVHKQFQTAYRNRTGKEAMSLDNLKHYFSSRKYYLGEIKQKTFKRFVTRSSEKIITEGYTNKIGIETNKQLEEKYTSCYAFLFNDLDIDIGTVKGIPELPFE